MAQRITRSLLQQRLFASAAKAVPKPPPAAAEVQVGKASNGIRVVAQESSSPLARVTCAVKAGCRNEETHQRGAAHSLRVITDMTQKEARAFGLTRELLQMGANVTCTSTREHLFYHLEVPKSSLKYALPYLTGMVVQQSFRPWEISDSMAKVEYELLALSEQADRRVVESVHRAAYRETGLGRSLYAPIFMLPEISPDMLQEYVNKTFTPDRISLSAMGMSLDELTAAAAKFDIGRPSAGTDTPSKYYGGEVRESSEDLIAYTILVGEGASLKSDELWAYAVLEQLLGSGPQIRWSSNTTSNMLNSAAQKQTQDPFNIQAFNVNYSDSGVFGISAVTVPENSDAVIRTAMEQLRSVSSGLPSKDSLQGAKNRVKASVAFSSECAGDVVGNRALELLEMGQLSNLKSTMAAIDAVSASSVQNAAKKLVNGKLSMASIGEIQNVPYIDQL